MLKRVVMMGGSIHRGYGDLGYAPDRGPSAEYNIAMDVASAQKLFASGVPITMAPLDSTQLKLDEVMRSILFRQSTPLTDSLAVLTHEWGGGHSATPTLFDVMAVEAAIEGDLCPSQPMHIKSMIGVHARGTGSAECDWCACILTRTAFFSFCCRG